MTTFDSDEVSIARSQNFVYDFLTDFNNFEKLMPSQISQWQSDGESCSFNIQNMATLAMRYQLREPHDNIKIISEGKSPFPFDLQCFIQEDGVESCKVKLQFNAKMNPMIKMMAARPLENFINILGVKLKEVCEGMVA